MATRGSKVTPSESETSFGIWWSSLMDRRGLSQRRLAALLSSAGEPVKHQSVNMWRHGTLPTGEARRRTIAVALGLTEEERSRMRLLLEVDEKRSLDERKRLARSYHAQSADAHRLPLRAEVAA